MKTLCCTVGIAALWLAGCASQAPAESRSALPQIRAGHSGWVQIRFDSNPMGAVVTRNGRKLGRTPMAYRVSVSAINEGGATKLACTSREVITFTWESGASTTMTELCSQSPTVVAVRPANAPGLEKDLLVESRYLARRHDVAIANRISYSLGPNPPREKEWPRGFEQNHFMGPPPYLPVPTD